MSASLSFQDTSSPYNTQTPAQVVRANTTIDMFLPVYKEVLPLANRIREDDYRYALLKTIPEKEHDSRDDTEYVYLQITDDKDYFITVEIRDANLNNHNYLEYPEYDFDDDVNDDDDKIETVVETQVQTFGYEANRVIWLSGKVVTNGKSIVIR
jgi:hypothetical protein